MTEHVCRMVVDLRLDFSKDKIGKPRAIKEQEVVRCGKPATKYQEGCYDPEDGWSCDEHYESQEEFDKL